MEKFDIDNLKEMARQIRRDIMKMLLISKSGHSGGPLGLSDIFASLYFNILKTDPNNPRWEERDYFFLSAGHLCPVWYATLARRGFIPLQELTTLGRSTGASRAIRLRPGHMVSPASRWHRGHWARGYQLPWGVPSVYGSIKSRTGYIAFTGTASSTRDRSGKR